MPFGENLKFQREAKNIYQSELAETVGTTQAAVSQYETGVRIPNAVLADKIAKALGTTVEWLVNRKGDNDDKQTEV